jgi:hypothetical protein
MRVSASGDFLGSSLLWTFFTHVNHDHAGRFHVVAE